MALVRILVDGYGLLRQWPGITPGKPRHTDLAREELIHRLTRYYDSSGVPITVVFGGPDAPHDLGPFPSTPEVETVYAPSARKGQQFLERLFHRLKSYGQVMVVADNLPERASIGSAGGVLSTCAEFVQVVEKTLAELEQNICQYNCQEQAKFRTH